MWPRIYISKNYDSKIQFDSIYRVFSQLLSTWKGKSSNLNAQLFSSMHKRLNQNDNIIPGALIAKAYYRSGQSTVILPSLYYYLNLKYEINLICILKP